LALASGVRAVEAPESKRGSRRGSADAEGGAAGPQALEPDSVAAVS